MDNFDQIIKGGKTTTEKALFLFDNLKSAELDFMNGIWKGSEFPTNHFLDGLLKASGWYGKSFRDQEHVHPLLFYNANKSGVFPINPGLLPLKLLKVPLPENKILRKTILFSRAVLQTKKHKARLRMMRYRGKFSAAMVYDDKPIIDIFRKVDDQTVLGLMDMKGMSEPFFFVLKRESEQRFANM